MKKKKGRLAWFVTTKTYFEEKYRSIWTDFLFSYRCLQLNTYNLDEFHTEKYQNSVRTMELTRIQYNDILK